MEQRHKLELIGITYQQVESNVFALILQAEGTTRRLPIFIGYAEAQAIECKLQDVNPPRPLTHDTMIRAMSAFGISLIEVEIRRLPNGVFAANLLISDGKMQRTIDSRSSDAVALAIRVGAPIYTSESVMREAGFDAETGKGVGQGARWKMSERKPEAPQPTAFSDDDIAELPEEMLEQAMEKAAADENYERAARIKKEIERRHGGDANV